MEENKLTVIVPIYNEEDTLPLFLSELVKYCQTNDWFLILVDDGSTDNSDEILNSYKEADGVKIINHKINKGYGAAIKTALRFTETPWVVTVDGDGQHDFHDIDSLLILAEEECADLVVGKRCEGSGFFRSIGKHLIRSFAKLLMPINIHDLNSGFKLYRTELVKLFAPICPDTMSFSDIITLFFINQKCKVLEYPIHIKSRQGGKSTINLSTAFDTVVNILNISMLFNPLRIFLPLSMLFFIIGLAWGIPIVLAGRGVSLGSLLLIICSLVFLSIGLIASQLSSIRLDSLNDKSNSISFHK